MANKICTKCKKDLPLKSFSKNQNNFDGMAYYCKSCASKQIKDSMDRKSVEHTHMLVFIRNLFETSQDVEIVRDAAKQLLNNKIK